MGTGFAQLFKKYRLLSEIETLAEFGDLLAEEGFVYETSLFTRWQKGDREPKERRVLLAILRVFAKRGGIVSIEEANTVVQSVNQKDLTHEESSALSEFIQTSNTKTLPVKPYLFVGRDELLKDLSWELINKKKVLLYGMPGVGKTYIAIYLAHQLKNFFSDGIFWFRADIKSYDDIVDELLSSFGLNVSLGSSEEVKLEKLNSALKNRDILIILDNIDNDLFTKRFDIKALRIPILASSVRKLSSEFSTYKVHPFSVEEFMKLSEKILGKPYLLTNKLDIEDIGKKIGYLPISSLLTIKQVYLYPTEIKSISSKFDNSNLKLDTLIYDHKSLSVTIDLVFRRLQLDEKKVLVACAVFEGQDFDIEHVSVITNISKKSIQSFFNKLIEISLLDLSVTNRYRLHPAIHAYLRTRVESTTIINLMKLYVNNLKKVSIGSDKYLAYFNKEYESIIGIINQGYKFGQYKLVTQIWQFVSTYIFISGDWGKILQFSSIIEDSYRKINDKYGLVIYWIEDLGRVYFFQKDTINARKLLQESSKIARSLQDNSLLGLISQKYGALYSSINKLDLAEEHLSKAIEQLQITKLIGQLAKTYAYLGMVYAKQGKDSLAIKYMGKALRDIQHIEDIPVIGYIYVYLGNSYLKINQLLDAEFYLRKGLKYSVKRNVLICCALAYEGLSELCQKKNKIFLQKKYLTKAQELYSTLGMHSS